MEAIDKRTLNRDEKALAKDIELAKKRQTALRKEAPGGITTGKTWKDPRKRLVELYVPESIGKDATMSPYFDSPEKHRRNIDLGWEPVIHNGEQVRSGSDLMYKRPIEFTKQHIANAEMQDKSRMQALDSEMAEAESAGLSVTENDVSVSKGKLQIE